MDTGNWSLALFSLEQGFAVSREIGVVAGFLSRPSVWRECPREYVQLRPSALGEGTGVAARSVVTYH
eukprot:1140259-Pelagomonas_calceolata.AAC.2